MRILISAYACEPGRGSEPGAGWFWAIAAAAQHEITVLTRASRAHTISPNDVPPRMTLRFVDLPRPLLRVVRSHERLYYVLWQVVAGVEASRLHRRERFDLVHHVTFANAWTPALASMARAPFILGPVGGGPTIPPQLLAELSRRARFFECLRVAVRRINTFNPVIRYGWSRARVIVAQNHETVEALPREYAAKATVRPHSVVGPDLERQSRLPRGRDEPGHPVAVLSGRLLPWKGGTIAVHALRRTRQEWHLEIIGAGPSETHLRELVYRLRLAARVSFTPWLPREELWRIIRRADAVLVPSLRDDAPFTIAEAQALGVPVVAFDQGGAAVMGRMSGTSVSLVRPASTAGAADAFAEALDDIAANGEPRHPSDAFGLGELENYVTRLYASVVGPESSSRR